MTYEHLVHCERCDARYERSEHWCSVRYEGGTIKFIGQCPVCRTMEGTYKAPLEAGVM